MGWGSSQVSLPGLRITVGLEPFGFTRMVGVEFWQEGGNPITGTPIPPVFEAAPTPTQEDIEWVVHCVRERTYTFSLVKSHPRLFHFRGNRALLVPVVSPGRHRAVFPEYHGM